jgi:hypothetical protein
MLDLIEQCRAGAENHGGFVRCVGHLAIEWLEVGLISGAERGRIMRCVAGSNRRSGQPAIRTAPAGMENIRE